MASFFNYFNDPNQASWGVHYIEGNYRGDYFLAFTEDWKEANLPKKSTRDELICNLLDTDTGKVYTMPIHAAYETLEAILNIQTYESDVYWSLMAYFYEEHHCPCHRHTDAVIAGLDESRDDFDCQGQRFLIQSITPPNSEIILLSETMEYQELEEKLLLLK